jgi:glycosyltransferase involved in cell wall biosynthesis
MTPAKKLLYIVNVDWFFLSHRLPIAKCAIEAGYEVHLATTLTGPRNRLEEHGIRVHPIRIDRASSNPISVVAEFFRMLTVIKDVQPDIVHLVTIKPVVLGGIAARLARVPAVVAAVSGLGHVFVAQGWKATLRRFLVRIAYRIAFGTRRLKVIFQNPDDRRILIRLTSLPSDKVSMIKGSGVDLAKFEPTQLPASRPVVILAARLLKDKGVYEFVEAARILRSRGVDVRFCLVGKVDPENPNSCTEEELAQWKTDGLVETWGVRSDMSEVFGRSHIVVLPSYYGEGLPKVLIEAAACGRAVITTDWPGCRDAIVPNVTGLLVPIKSPSDLADSVARLLTDRAMCSEMGKAGRALAEREFGISRVVEGHLNIYRELLDLPQQRSSHDFSSFGC